MSATVLPGPLALDRPAWDRFVHASPQGSVFCRADLLDALDRPWEVVWLDDGLAAGAAALTFRESDGRVARAPLPFTPYQGLLLDADLAGMPAHRRSRETLERLTALLERLRSHGRISFCLAPAFPDVRALSWFNYDHPADGRFTIDVRYTGEIALPADRSLDGFLARCRSVRRQEFRKAAARFGVESNADLDLLDRLHRLTFERQGMARPEREGGLLRSIAAAALRHGFGELLVARDRDGTPASAALFLFDGRAAYYLVAANDPAFRNAGTSTLLLVEGARRALDRGLVVLDVVGMNSPARGDFKTSFGAVPVPYLVAHWEGR